MLGFTGTWNGVPVSVMGTGMGMPSHSIYVQELIQEYGCKKLIRIGSCGSLQKRVKIRDIILAMSSCFDSSLNTLRFKGMGFAPSADFELLEQAYQLGKNKGLDLHVGPILSSDWFYEPDPNGWKLWAEYNVLAVEMETAALYTLAAAAGVQALSILTVSDSLVTKESTSSQHREKTFTEMMELALGLVG